MLKGLCVNKGDSTVLVVGEPYFLFPNGEDHYYVSKFPNCGAHTGCFQSSLFQILTNDEQDSSLSLNKNNVYRAKLIWRKEGYKNIELKEYYLVPHKTHADFYDEQALKVYRGCFPLHWFTDFIEVINIIEKTRIEKVIVDNVPPEEDDLIQEYEQLTLF